MDRELRRCFNEAFTPELYSRMQADLAAATGCEPAFRLAESPLFLPADLRARCETAACEIVDAVSQPELLVRLERFVPKDRWVMGGAELPTISLVDLAIVRGASGALEPRLIEMQGFPSLHAFTLVQFDVWSRVLASMPGMPQRWSAFFGGLDRDAYLRLLRRAIVGDCDPSEVVLVDLDPPTQKTSIDFVATRQLLGVDAVCLTALELDRASRRLFRRVDGKRVPVRRIYNRIVFDEIDKKGVRFPFDLRERVDVEWSPHPNWYWTWSKAVLPFLDHPAVPRARLVSEIDELPSDLSRYVLKPLFSFAGTGVKVNVTAKDVVAIAPAERGLWILQEKIDYAPALEAADGGGVKAEIRMMFLRDPAEPHPRLAFNLVRLSRGAMLGVDFNKDFTWVGSSLAMWPA